MFRATSNHRCQRVYQDTLLFHIILPAQVGDAFDDCYVHQPLFCEIQLDGHMHRYLFDDKTVRYIKVMTGPQNHHFHDQALPIIPAGDWNCATIDIDRIQVSRPSKRPREDVSKEPGSQPRKHGILPQSIILT